MVHNIQGGLSTLPLVALSSSSFLLSLSISLEYHLFASVTLDVGISPSLKFNEHIELIVCNWEIL